MSDVLDRCLLDAGYTPPLAALPTLLAELELLDEEREKALRRALTRAGAPAIECAVGALPTASPLLRERLLTLLAAFASSQNEHLLAPLLTALADPSPRCRRAAARALGKLGDPRAEEPLLNTLYSADLPEQRALVEALGKVGGERTREALARFDAADTDLQRRVENARVLVERRTNRSDEPVLVFDRPLPGPSRVVARCRSGLGGVLRDEAREAWPVLDGTDAAVVIEHAGTLGDLLALRTALDFGLVVALDMSVDDPAERIARALESDAALGIFSAWSSGKARVRLSFAAAGHRRAFAWSIARQLLASRVVENDPRSSAFIAEIGDESATELLLVPRLSPDPRFAYRLKDVPAASHPTIAAALARLAGVRADDVIWDPFAGSGLELIERARLGPYARAIGSDVSALALEATRQNIAAAGMERVELHRADARNFRPSGVRLIISNPPMGRRVARDGSLRVLLEEFVVHASRVLEPGGRLVWLSPLERHTARAGLESGLALQQGPELDLGGFRARIQAFERRRARRT